MSRQFLSKFSGKCAKCYGTINIGDPISWSRTSPRGARTWHITCPTTSTMPTTVYDEPTEDTTTMTPIPDTTPTPEPSKRKAKHDGLTQTLIDAIMPDLVEQFQPKATEQVIDESVVVGLIQKHSTLRIEVVSKDKPTVTVEGAHKSMPDLIGALLDGEAVYMYGPAGTGKTHGALQAFKALGLDAEFISLNLQTSDTRLSGFIDANGVYRDTGFERAYTNGKGMLIDEVDNASGNVLTALNSAIANGHASFPNGVRAKHPDFRLVTTGNTVGKGASRVYSDRRQLDGAFLDRFEFLEWGYDNKLELAIALSLRENSAPVVEWVQGVREFCAKEYPSVLVTPRATSRILKGLNRGKSLAATLDGALWHGLDADSVKRIVTANPLPRGV